MGASPFLGGLWQNPYKGKAPFFRAITKLHNKDYTTDWNSVV
jgi:hypothetical protein